LGVGVCELGEHRPAQSEQAEARASPDAYGQAAGLGATRLDTVCAPASGGSRQPL